VHAKPNVLMVFVAAPIGLLSVRLLRGTEGMSDRPPGLARMPADANLLIPSRRRSRIITTSPSVTNTALPRSLEAMPAYGDEPGCPPFRSPRPAKLRNFQPPHLRSIHPTATDELATAGDALPLLIKNRDIVLALPRR
jgi:hypothetical protein